MMIEKPPRTILVVHIAGLGQTAMALPALRSLRQTLPDTHITVAASAAGAEVIRLAECANEVLALGRFRHGEIVGPRMMYRSFKSLREASRHQYDLAIELQRNSEGAVLMNFAHPDQRINSKSHGQVLRSVVNRLATVLSKAPGERHQAQKYLEMLTPLGVRPLESEPRVRTSRAADEQIDKLLDKSGWRPGELLAGIHPGAGSADKRWPADRFALLADRFIHNLNAFVIVFAGPQERALAKQIMAQLPKGRAMVFDKLSTPEFLSALARLSLFAGNLSGPAQLAAAAGAPVVAISGAERPTAYDLLGPGHKHVRGLRLDLISVEDVYDAASLVIQGSRAERLIYRI